MTPNNRTEPGVCTRCGDTRLIPIGDGYSVNPCPDCTGQQPTQQPGVCPECKGSCRTGSGYLREDCPACNGTGQQPAQPESGEVKRYVGRITELEPSPVQHVVLASDFERLQSALTAAKAYADDMEARYHTAHERLTAAQQRIAELERDLENERARGIHTCHDQCERPLCVAQRRIAELRGCLAELTALVNGESPALLNEDSGGDGELAVRIDNALEEPS